MPTSTITSKGQVTIPKRIREFLKVKAGDQLDFVIADDGRVLVRPGTVGVDELKGLLHRPGRRPVTLAQMEAAIVRRAMASGRDRARRQYLGPVSDPGRSGSVPSRQRSHRRGDPTR